MIQLNLTEKNKQIHFSYKGKYIVFFEGVRYASNKGNFRIEIKSNKTDKLVKVKVPFLKSSEGNLFNGRIHYAYIEIPEIGDYTINFINIEDLKISNNIIWPLWFILPSSVNPNRVLVEIGR